MNTTTSQRKITTYPDGTLKVEVIDTRTIEQKLNGNLTFAEKMAIKYPTRDEDVTKDWCGFDNHKRVN